MIRGSESPALHNDSAQIAASAVAAARRRASVRELSPLAREIAAEPVAEAISPLVLAGIVRAIEFTLIAALGIAVYSYTTYPIEGIDWRYAFAGVTISVTAMVAFQVLDLYTTAAFRTHVH